MTKITISIGVIAIIALLIAGTYVYIQTTQQQTALQTFAARKEDLSMQQQSLDVAITNLNAQIATQKILQEALVKQVENISTEPINLTPIPDPVVIVTPPVVQPTPPPAPTPAPRRRTRAS